MESDDVSKHPDLSLRETRTSERTHVSFSFSSTCRIEEVPAIVEEVMLQIEQGRQSLEGSIPSLNCLYLKGCDCVSCERPIDRNYAGPISLSLLHTTGTQFNATNAIC